MCTFMRRVLLLISYSFIVGYRYPGTVLYFYVPFCLLGTVLYARRVVVYIGLLS